MTEHMFGTLKRQRGFTFALMRGKENVLGEVGLMFIGYNLSRSVSVLGAKKLIEALKKCCLPGLKGKIRTLLSLLRHFYENCKFLYKTETENFYAHRTSMLRSC